MEAQLKAGGGRLVIKVEAATAKDLFKQLAACDEIFNAESQCGLCESKDLRFVVRTVDSNDFFELRCADCNARFAFGQHKTGGTLFPKRSTGWTKYAKDTESAA
jgi:hypothetical protein